MGRSSNERRTLKRRWWSLLLCASPAFSTHAEVVMGSTRLVYPADDAEIALRASNPGKRPALVQVWIDSGDPEQSPDDSDAPFLITPPVVTVAASSAQRFRIRHTGEPLPGDRESVFWVNLLEVPPVLPSEGMGNRLHVVFRSRIKLFYRPEGLPGEPEQAAGSLRCRLDAAVAPALACVNPSAFHISLIGLSLRGLDVPLTQEGARVIAPFEEVRIPLPDAAGTSATGALRLTVVNDYGGRSEFDVPLQP